MINLSEYRQKTMENFDAAVQKKMFLLSKTECSINASQGNLNTEIIKECQISKQTRTCYVQLHRPAQTVLTTKIRTKDWHFCHIRPPG